MAHIHNYSAGPCILPAEVLKQASQAVKSWDDHGLSLVEMSHRSKAFVEAMEECRALTKETARSARPIRNPLPARWCKPGILDGGDEFAAGRRTKRPTPIRARGRPKPSKRPSMQATTSTVTSSKDSNYDHIPFVGDVDAQNAFLRITTNNTIFGTSTRPCLPATFRWWRT